jgi:hypothetical protein
MFQKAAKEKFRLRRPLAFICVLFSLAGCHTETPSRAPVQTAPVPTTELDVYPDSTAGMQAQMDDMIRKIRMPDQSPFMAALDSLAIPHANEWIAAHFPTYASAQLQQDYTKASAGYRSHVWSVMGNFAKSAEFKISVEPSDLPAPLAVSGMEALLPRPNTTVKIENYRFSPASSKPPSWVSSFVYIEGRFRFVGGTYPFWAELLTSMRGPMAVSAERVGNLTIQAVPFDVDPNTPGVVSVVVFDVKIGANGKALGFTVRSGDPKYVKQAEDYVASWKFFPIATTYPLNVVFFSTKQ